MENKTRAKKELSLEEFTMFEKLVSWGDAIRKEHRKERQDAYAQAQVERFGKKGEWREGWKRKRKKAFDQPTDDWPSVPVIKWFLARNAGFNSQKAAAMSGATWGDVIVANRESYSARVALLAIRENNRAMMTEMAYGVLSDALTGERKVDMVSAKVAQWGLERLDGDNFIDPRLRASESEAETKKVGGGIIINLIDTSKPYVPPLAAKQIDPEEFIEV